MQIPASEIPLQAVREGEITDVTACQLRLAAYDADGEIVGYGEEWFVPDDLAAARARHPSGATDWPDLKAVD